ncbi:CHAT domain protein [Streptomyces sp. S4.7]|nr:CHAT domain protein [Streptomyces sp. S4.7]
MFTALPLHAAGHHREGGPALLDRAASSYTPTVRALAAARSQSGATVPGGSRLVVSVPSAPNAPALPSAAEEAELVRAAAPGATTLLTDAAATRDRVLAELPRHSWAHFACHAAPDPRAPSRSGLLLQGHARGALTVADVSTLDLRGSRLAYLSACETAAVGPRHVDEAIHLASAFQLAGFSHVVSTLWQLPDRAVYRLAQAMYTEFSEAGRDGGEVAGVVHAVNRLLPYVQHDQECQGAQPRGDERTAAGRRQLREQQRTRPQCRHRASQHRRIASGAQHQRADRHEPGGAHTGTARPRPDRRVVSRATAASRLPARRYASTQLLSTHALFVSRSSAYANGSVRVGS